jgi:hypothetical protein
MEAFFSSSLHNENLGFPFFLLVQSKEVVQGLFGGLGGVAGVR